MANPTGLEVERRHIDKDQYLASLPEKDRENLKRISRIFEDIMRKSGRIGALIAVGGTLTKPLPRKDIDLVLLRQITPVDPQHRSSSTNYDYAKADFQLFQSLIKEVAKTEPQLTIGTIIEPCIDEEFDNPYILKNAGSIQLIDRAGGTPIEVIRMDPEPSYKRTIAEENKPYIILAEVPET